MSAPRCRISEEILSELERLGVKNWTAEQGTKHTKLRIDGRMVAILPRGGGDKTGYSMRNAIASIRRAARGGASR